MNERRALVLVLALGGVLATWAAARYARDVEQRQPAAAADALADPGAGAEKVTLRFFPARLMLASGTQSVSPAHMPQDKDG